MWTFYRFHSFLWYKLYISFIPLSLPCSSIFLMHKLFCLFTADIKPLSYWCFKQFIFYTSMLWWCRGVICFVSLIFFPNCFLSSFSCYGLQEGCPVQILCLSLIWLLCFWVNSFPDFHFAVQVFITGSLQACQDSASTSCEFWLVLLSQ